MFVLDELPAGFTVYIALEHGGPESNQLRQ